MLRARLQGGLLNKARRGALKVNLPVGFVYGSDDRIGFDPNQPVQATIRFLFGTFARVGSASGVVRIFRQEQLTWPVGSDGAFIEAS